LKKLVHLLGFRIAVIAAIALFFAQLGAMNHAYSHLPRSVAATAQQTNSASRDVCDDCLSFAPVLSAAGSSAALPLIEPPARITALRAVATSLVNRRPNLAFRSRAPPVIA
jgi:hypothetical protein